LKDFDYSSAGKYFITICTKNREDLFGKIENGIMRLSEIGEITKQIWEESFNIRRELFCEEYTIMPNHIHAIVTINHQNIVETHGRASLPENVWHGNAGKTTGRASLQNGHRNGVARRTPKSISSFVAGFKSVVTKQINKYIKSPGVPVWQSRFYDHIIRNESELNRIREYIITNPLNWMEDENNRELINAKKMIRT
jgi:REP element-mobilizing transposase RayT